MYLKTYVLLLVLGMSLALPQDAEKSKEVVKKEEPKKDAAKVAVKSDEAKLAAKPTQKEVEAKPAKPVKVEEPLPEVVDEEYVEEEPFLEDGGEVLPEDEVPLEEEVEEFSCEYTDTAETAITVYFIKDDAGVEQGTEIVPEDLTESIDEKLKECLQQDLTGRRNVKRRKNRRRPGKRRPGQKRRGGQRRSGTSGGALRELRRRIAGPPARVTVGEMKQAIKLAQRYIAAKGKEARKRKVLARKKKNAKKRG